MSDTPNIDVPTPGAEATGETSQTSKPDLWAFLKDFKTRMDSKIHRTEAKPQETSQITKVEAKSSHPIMDELVIAQKEEASPENVTKIEIPVPGTAPIPEGNIRLFHFTYPNMLENIRVEGITRKNHENSSDIGLNSEPDSTFAYSDLNLNNPPGWTIGKPYLEFSAPPSDMGPHNAVAKEGTARTLKPGVDIPPEKIIAIHEPWHEMVRHSKNGAIDPEWLKSYVGRSVEIAGNHNTRGNYTDYGEMIKQRQYLESQVMEANKYINSPDLPTPKL